MSALPNPTPRPWCIMGGRLYGAQDDDNRHPPIAESIIKRVAHDDPRRLQWFADLAFIVEAVNAYNPEPRSAKDQAEWDRREAYRKGFEIGGGAERERADWLEAELERVRGALTEALAVIDDYLDYRHDGDPWTEDARQMGEMRINDYGRDGSLTAAKALLAGDPT